MEDRRLPEQALLLDDRNTEEQLSDDKTSKYQSFRTKILFSTFLYIMIAFHGLNNNVLGPSLIDLENLTNSNTSSITAVFTWKYGGYFLGTMISGPIVDRVDPMLVVGLALCVSATATALTPIWGSLMGLFITSGCSGIAIAFNTVCAAATMLEIWGTDAKPYQQALHFFRTLGGVFTPQIMKPFLNSATTNINETYLLHGLEVFKNITMPQNITKPLCAGDSGSRVWIGYLIVAGCLMTSAVTSITVFACQGCSIEKSVYSDKVTVQKCFFIEGAQKIIILILFFIQSFIVGGIQEVLGGLTLTFLVKYLGWDKDSALDVNTVFWVTITIGRAMVIILSKYFQSSKLVAYQLAILLIATMTMTFAVDLHPNVLWVYFASSGLAMGSLFPTLINWAHECMSTHGKETAIFFAGSSFAKMTTPPLIGFLVDRLGAMWFVYMILIQVGLFIICYIVTAILIKQFLDRIKQNIHLRELAKEN